LLNTLIDEIEELVLSAFGEKLHILHNWNNHTLLFHFNFCLCIWFI